MGFLPLLPSGGKSGRRMNYGISATSAIRWQKWQKDELRDFCHQVAKWQKDELRDFCHFYHQVLHFSALDDQSIKNIPLYMQYLPTHICMYIHDCTYKSIMLVLSS